jgi:hypothetical protein
MPADRKGWKWRVAIVGFVLAMQLIPIDRDNPPVDFELPAPPAVDAILKRSCYDCHSHETRRPWYAWVAPASWLLAHDISEARSELNFSTWKAYRPDKQSSLLRDAVEEIEEGEMPPWTYLLLHGDARPSEQEVATLRDWIDSTDE